jgi:hypothetical protein
MVPIRATALLAATFVLFGCGNRSAESGSVQPPPATDDWVGTWNGPEGTFLRIDGGKGAYDITIQNLDGARSFQGRALGGGIQFERDGIKESIRATDGADTGMKWLADKSNCLTVRQGEGYCRD